MRTGSPSPPALAAVLAALLASPAAATTTAPPGDRSFEIRIEKTGVYRVGYAELAGAAGTPLDLRSDRLTLTVRDRPVPIWVADGGDGRFGPGDHLEFVGERLRGERTYNHPHDRYNVYRLRTDADGGARMRPSEPPSGSEGFRPADLFSVAAHLEEDRLLLRFPNRGREGNDPDPWYWARLTHLDRRPFQLRLDLWDYRWNAEEPLSLTLELRGWSNPRRIHRRDPEAAEPPPDHRVEVRLNGVEIGAAEWQDQESYRLELPAIPEEAMERGKNLLELVVPERRPDPEGDPIIDVVMLDWISLRHPRRRYVGDHQAELRLTAAEAERKAVLNTDPDRRLVVYGAAGSRVDPASMQTEERNGRRIHFFLPPDGEETLYAVPVAESGAEADPAGDGSAYLRPVSVTVDSPSHLRDPERRADYLMISHPRLIDAVAPLADFHRRRGLEVALIDVEEIYDEFNHGVVDPAAIRDFIAFAHRRWRRPAPRFVLLVGDASWDIRNTDPDDDRYADWTYRPGEVHRFVKNDSIPYARETSLPHRNLIPTWAYDSSQGHAASDNYFVAVEGDDHLPDLAIGRFPVTEPEEVAGIVGKLLRYAEEASAGSWQRRVLWITNQEIGYQRRSDRIAVEIEERGFDSLKVYPSPDEADNKRHQAALRQAFDDGQLLVHFYGHGGRYIWRTGPPDYEKNHDLFTLDDLDRLAPSDELPVVLSMSCYSAPFDHPTADSIGEKFLRLPDRGAVAVFAASWRNSPSVAFSRRLLDELTQPGTLGEAIVRAKRAIKHRTMVEMYNLLGDPATELALPAPSPVTAGATAATEPSPGERP